MIYDVAIIGGGLSGLTLASLLGQDGLKVACIDQEDPKTLLKNDLRTTAISYGSKKILEKAGIWKAIAKKACPIDDIRILDGNSPVLLDFQSFEVGNESFGWIVENVYLRKALMDRVKKLQSVSHFTSSKLMDYSYLDYKKNILNTEDFHVGRHKKSLEDSDHIQEMTAYVSCKIHNIKKANNVKSQVIAKLLVGADGRFSPIRESLEEEAHSWDYNQQAVICNIIHEKPHNNVAFEHFWPGGPFAILPMCDDEQKNHRSSLVFTEHRKKQNSTRSRGSSYSKKKHQNTASLMDLSEEEFAFVVQQRFPDQYGKITIANSRRAFPLSLTHPSTYIGERIALIADAAHAIHPIAGQGLNLGFRDVLELSHLVLDAHNSNLDPGSFALLEKYQRRRRPDNTAMVAFTDGLVRLFSNDFLPVKILRRAGLKAVSQLPPAKRFFMKKAMGE